MSSPLVRNTSASYFQFQQSLDQYVFFSPLTMGGASGRAVKIHKDLFLPFFCVVDPSSHDGQAIIRQIENLRTTCTIVRRETGCGDTRGPKQDERHKTRLGKVNSAFHQVLIIKNLHVYYRVSQEAGDKAPSIYISSIRQIHTDTGSSPGLYESNRYGDSEKIDSSKVDGRKIYINSVSRTVEDALHDAYNATKDNKTALFYSPARVSGELGMMGTTTKSRITTQAINELTDIFKKNQKLSTGISWYAEGEGVNLLAAAIKQVPGELNKHEFRFINPVANTASLVQSLKDKKARFEGELYVNNNARILALSGIQKDQLLQAIGKLPAGKNYNLATRNKIAGSINTSTKSGAKVNSQPVQPAATKTFLQLLKTAGIHRT